MINRKKIAQIIEIADEIYKADKSLLDCDNKHKRVDWVTDWVTERVTERVERSVGNGELGLGNVAEGTNTPRTAITRRSVLDEATRCVCTDRNNQYGEPEGNFAAIAGLWSEYLGVHINAHHVAMMMALFKIGRIMTGGAKADSYVDACGYLACAAEIALKSTHTTDANVGNNN